jgi:aminopeptidase N
MLLTSRRLRAALLATASATLVAAALPPPAPLGIGDSLFPHLGNPGYDVLAYDIAFTYRGSNTQPLDAVTRIDARAAQRLERINLDFSHGTVRTVEVNGRPAEFTTAGEDLVVEPAAAVEQDSRMRITVTHTSDPTGPAGEGGWVRTADGLAMANQADAAHRVFPCNDHPADKAYFTFRITAPKELTAVANGARKVKVWTGTNTTWAYQTKHPMATELAQVSIGRSAVLHRQGPGGLVVRDVVPAADREKLEPWLKKTPGHLEWMEKKVGRYPFETYGLLIADAATGFELETQTLSLFERSLFTDGEYPEWYVDSVMVHELAHQWFGDSVSPATWSDLWLNEGHATWYEQRFSAEFYGSNLELFIKNAYAEGDVWRAAFGPIAAPRFSDIALFSPAVYEGGATVLFALQQRIGTTAFQRLEREWLRRYRDESPGTRDFIALASRVAGQDLSGFLHSWLYGTKTPPMPGHPDWTVKPAAAAPALAAGSSGLAAKSAPEPLLRRR